MTKIGCIYENTQTKELLILINFTRGDYTFCDEAGNYSDVPKTANYKQVTSKSKVNGFLCALRNSGHYQTVRDSIKRSADSGDGTMKYLEYIN